MYIYIKGFLGDKTHFGRDKSGTNGKKIKKAKNHKKNSQGLFGDKWQFRGQNGDK